MIQVRLIWNWFEVMDIIDNEMGLVQDGIDPDGCVLNRNIWTYNQGVLLGGLMYLGNIDQNDTLLNMAYSIANSTLNHLTTNGILTEPCDEDLSCSDNNEIFKGIFVRYLRYLIDNSEPFYQEYYREFLTRNANSVWMTDSCFQGAECPMTFDDGPPLNNVTSPVFDVRWFGPYNYSQPQKVVCL